MNTTLFDFTIAILFLVIAAALIVWFRGKLATASRSRMYRMMARLGVQPDKLSDAPSGTGAEMQAVRIRCRMCPCEDLCERWLAGEVEGDHGFCPNASVFDGVLRTG